MIGTTIGTYRILSKLGAGGMGTVYVAEHTLLGRRAAIKVLLPEMSLNQKIVNRFFNEARAVTTISDPGIVQVFDFGFHVDGSAFIVMELLLGESLEGRLQRSRRLQPLDALRICRQVSTSLAAAHARGVIHRDLKPDNIFLVTDPAVPGGERAKILDFGIAKLSVDPGKEATRTGMLIGTPVYMSPEQCRGAGDIDSRSDIYSLGCMLFRMLVGRPPFDGYGSGEIIASHLKEPPPTVRSMLASIEPEIDALVARCLAKNPADRPQTAVELADLLGALEGVTTYKTPVPGYSAPLMAAQLPAHLTPRPGTGPVAAQLPSTGFTAPDYTPIPDGHQRPYTASEPTSVLPMMQPSSTPTTMQSAAGEASHPVIPMKKRRGFALAGGLAALAVVGGIVAMVAVTGGTSERSDKAEHAAATQPAPAAPVASPPVTSPPVTSPPVTAPPVPVEHAAVTAPVTPPVEASAAKPTTKPIKKPIARPVKAKPDGPKATPTPTPTGPIDRGD